MPVKLNRKIHHRRKIGPLKSIITDLYITYFQHVVDVVKTDFLSPHIAQFAMC